MEHGERGADVAGAERVAQARADQRADAAALFYAAMAMACACWRRHACGGVDDEDHADEARGEVQPAAYPGRRMLRFEIERFVDKERQPHEPQRGPTQEALGAVWLGDGALGSHERRQYAPARWWVG